METINTEVKLITEELSEVLEKRKLEEGTSILKIGNHPKGLFIINAKDIEDIAGASMVGKVAGDLVTVGLRELILRIPAADHIKVANDCEAHFLSADDFIRYFEQTEWFPRAISRILTNRIDVSSLTEELKRVSRLEKLVEVSRVINSTLDLNKMLKMILDTALEGVNGDRGTVYLLEEEKNELWSKVFEGGKSVTIRLPVGKGIAGKVAETGEIMNIQDASKDSRFNPEIDKKTGYKTKSILCMPLRNKEKKMLGVFQLLNKKNGTFTVEDEQFIETLSIQVSSALENARLYKQEQKKIEMEKEMSAAAEVQKNLFPAHITQVPGYQISAVNIPAKETSGDMYDFIPFSDNKVVFTLGDVSGKGLPAAILMATLQTVLHDLPHYKCSPAYCLSRSNEIISRVSSSGKFITLFFGVLDADEHKLTYSNAGHEHPYLIRNGSVERLKEGGVPIGVLPDSPFGEHEYPINPGDLLVVFSDGVNDASNSRGEHFSEERLEKLIYDNQHLNPDDLIDLICREIKNFTEDEEQFDDITLVVIRRDS